MASVYIRTLLVYFMLIITLRLMGKRQIGELQLSELIVTILLSELAAIPIADKDIPLLYAIVPILLLLSLEVILSYVVLRVPGIKNLFAGRPSIIIHKGVLNQKELERQRTGISELLCSLRQSGISDIGEVEYAILEQNGRFSVFPKAANSSVTPTQLDLDISEQGISHALILDRKVIRDNLILAGWDEKRLFQELKRRGFTKEDIFLFSVNDTGDITIIIKEKKS
ncbi:MAG: DUF421 domain-containing protein [Clostridiales bacterium]|jgi:uncharacterized membrane protein YcaP (DUF421 family)|nr:DUF421 domain-containing protein [Clostridiales bacterium]